MIHQSYKSSTVIEAPLLAVINKTSSLGLLNLGQLQVVGRQHSCLTSPLHSTRHPAGINALHLVDQVTFNEAHLVYVLCLVVVNSAENSLEFRISGEFVG